MARRKNKFPLHIERMMVDIYAGALRRLAKRVMSGIKRTYKAERENLPAAVIKVDESFREYLARMMDEDPEIMTNQYIQYQIERVEMALRSYAFRTVSDSMKAIKDTKKREYAKFGIKQAIDSPFIQSVTDNFIMTNMKMLDLVGKDYMAGIQEAAMNTFLNGGSMQELEDEMFDYTEGDTAKAEFWARDQVGDAYSSYADELFKEAGIDNFIWRTTGDNHVREAHAELEGRIFSMAKGAPAGTLSKPGARLPGQDYNCRCTAEPTLEEPEEGLSGE
jgi:SPP1 gp7 family putative phage head morphogenesis protein